ncbi:hypothetical protein AB0N88_36390 [Streptomyces sp. NPDC093516]|uniref:hypothetical protein n=1 Tax=Streptomyces sp. NPDC093516 TaxID=3155304 RepID=UPI00342C8754
MSVIVWTRGGSGVAQQWAAIEPERVATALDGRRVDGTLVAWLESRTDELRALTNTNAPECTDLVHALLRTTIGLIDDAAYDHPTERRLHQVAASAAQCAGWLHFDQGEYAAAQRHWSAALHAAHAAHNRDLGAGILTDFAYFATWLDHPATAVSVLEHAHCRTTSPAARALLHLRRAGALAMLGDRSATSLSSPPSRTSTGPSPPPRRPGPPGCRLPTSPPTPAAAG